MSAHELIADRIRERGPITVADFMSIALYHPTEGYYARASRRTGRQGDFITSVDIGPLFGALLCRQLAEMWRLLRSHSSADSRIPNPEPPIPNPQSPIPHADFDLVEAGASNGQLARDILDAAEREDPAFYRAIRLSLIEASPAARAAQSHVLAHHEAKTVHAGSSLPDAIHGVIYANELLDALPVHSVLMTERGLREYYVDLDGDRLVERIKEPSTPALERHLQALGIMLEPGWRAEVNLEAVAWMTRACAALRRGFLVLIDYGHEARELYSAGHGAGTLTTFTKHVPGQAQLAAPSWLIAPGTRDITAHVDLTSIRYAAESLGLDTLGMLDQTYFLLALGLGDTERSDEGPGSRRIAKAQGNRTATDSSQSAADIKRRLALKTLVVPGGLGSTHKVMIFGKGVGTPSLRGLSGMSRLT